MKNTSRFKENMALLGEVYDRNISQVLIELYWKVLEPFTDEQCEKAFKEIIKTSKFFPKPADFIEILQGQKADRAIEAWVMVVDAIKRVGNYRSVQFADPVIHSVIEVMGGWDRLAGTMTIDEQKWKQKEFEKLYIVMSRRGSHKEYLPGRDEMTNQGHLISDYEARTGEKYKPEIVKIGLNKKQIA